MDSHSSSTSGQAERMIWVLDPLTRKLRVPLSLLAPSQATVATGTVPSLCMAFLESRCRHSWCRQAHVLPSHIADLRRQALNAPTCCSAHHDPHDLSVLTSRYSYVTVADMQLAEPIPANRIALTVGLQRFLTQIAPPSPAAPHQQQILEIPSRLVCRLHLSHRCRYVEDCNNVHICREYELKLNPPPQLLPTLCGISPSSRLVTINDTAFAVTMLAEGEVSDTVFHAMCDEQQKLVQQQPFAFSSSSAAATPVMQASVPPPPPPPMPPPTYAAAVTSAPQQHGSSTAACGTSSSSSFFVSAPPEVEYPVVSPLLLSTSATGFSTPARSTYRNATGVASNVASCSAGTAVPAFQLNGTPPIGSAYATPTIGPQRVGSSPPLPAAIPVEAFSNNSSFLGGSLTGLPPPPPPPPPSATAGTSPLQRAPPAYTCALHNDLMLPPPAMTSPPPRLSSQHQQQQQLPTKPLLLRTSVLRVYDVRDRQYQQQSEALLTIQASPSPQRSDRDVGNTSHTSSYSIGLTSGYASRDTSVSM